MGKSYQRKTNHSRRKMQKLDGQAVTVDPADGKAAFQMILPMSEMLFDVAKATEKTASQAGLLMMKALVDEEVEQLAGSRYEHNHQRQAVRRGNDEGHVIFAGRKVAIERPRLRSKEGSREISLSRFNAFAHPYRMQNAVSERILRRVSTRDYAGVPDDLCDGYGIDKSSVSRHWKAAGARKLRQLLERSLHDLQLCVILIDGKEFHDFTLITALGIDIEGRKHVLGLWPGATENSQVCVQLLDELIERGLSTRQRYLFILDGSKALAKAVKARFGRQVLRYSRRMVLFLPIGSATERLPASNLLKLARSGFGRAKNDSGNSSETALVFDDKLYPAIMGLLATTDYRTDNFSAKSPLGLQNQRFCMPIS